MRFFKKLVSIGIKNKFNLSNIVLIDTETVINPCLADSSLEKKTRIAKNIWQENIGDLSPEIESYIDFLFKKSLTNLGCNYAELFKLAPFKEHFEQFATLCDSFLAINIKIVPFPLDAELTQAKLSYESLKENLETYNHPKKELFNVRSGSLFKWCYVAIFNLVFEPFKALFPETNADSFQVELAKLGTKIAIFDTYLDDIADNIQDSLLTNLFCKIPFASQIELDEIRTELSQYQDGIFLEFFNTTYKLWQNITIDLRALLGNKTLETNAIYPLFQEHISGLTDVMKYSVKLNNSLHDLSLQELPSFQEMEAGLSANMMVKILFDTQRMALYSLGYELPECIKEKFNTLTEMIEKSFHHANSFATYKREIEERDITNGIFKLSEIFLENGLRFWKITHPEATLNEFIQIKYTKGVPFDTPILSFLDLFRDGPSSDTLLKKKVLNELTESKDVVSGYFENWSQLNDKIGSLSEEIILDLKNENLINKDILINSFKKFKIHNEIFLGFYMIVSSFKGVT